MSVPTQARIPDWVKEKADKIATMPKGKYYKFAEGETEITIDVTKPPVEVQKFNKTRYVYNIKADEKDYVLECGSQLDTLIISALMKGLNPMVVIRAGKGINTTYSIKGLTD